MALSLKGLFPIKGFNLWKTRKSILGIDIGSSSIKLVQLNKEKERAVLETYGEISLGQYDKLSVGQSARLSEDKIIEALTDIINESEAKAKYASVSIPLKSSFMTILDLPSMPEKKLGEVVKLEARRYVPTPISEVLLDWWVVPDSIEKDQTTSEEKKKRPIRILLVAIHKDTIERYKKIFSKVNLEVRSFEIEIFSIVRSCAFRTNQPVIVIDFGASTTKIVIIDHGIIRLSHSIDKGSQNLTMALSNSLNVDFTRAEETKREIGLSIMPEHKEIVSIMETDLEYIFSESNKVIKNYQKRYNRMVNRVILTGGGSLLKGLIDFSVKRFNIEVGISDPFSKVEYPPFLNDVLKEVGPSFSTSLGLAIREI